MNRLTEKVIRLALEEDPEITSKQAREVAEVLKGRSRPVGSAEMGQEAILVSNREAARLLSVSRQTLWRLEKHGVIKPVVLGHAGGHRIKRYALEGLRKLAR
ncbi:MAG: hypothetical protein HN341_11890 [Verrucomicrobia bacterium]|jgi:hypothetical protein|nr:hypothetical protein [Verrucomicrobiota bacterium]MBT7068977.1 hypothetical protein [Verrucomicrobiota bacterium]